MSTWRHFSSCVCLNCMNNVCEFLCGESVILLSHVIFIFIIFLRSAHDFNDGFLIAGFRMKCDRCAHKAFTTSDAILGQLSIVQRSMYPFQLSGQSGLSQV